jgi:ribosome-binding protein aMBF1 (putative translation factor)
MEVSKKMTATEESSAAYCEQCGRESAHIIKQIEPDGAKRDVCWKCVSRVEKRFNLKETWKRGGRARSPQ